MKAIEEFGLTVGVAATTSEIKAHAGTGNTEIVAWQRDEGELR